MGKVKGETGSHRVLVTCARTITDANNASPRFFCLLTVSSTNTETLVTQEVSSR